MVPQMKAGELKFLVGWRRVRSRRRRRRRRRLSRPAQTKRSGIIAAAWHWPGWARPAKADFNKICQSHDSRDVDNFAPKPGFFAFKRES